MKIKINKKFKAVSIPVIIIMILGLTILFYLELSSAKTKDVKTSIYTWESKGKINYSVSLKPNILYSGDTLEEGGIYLSEFINCINAGFKYDYNGESDAEIAGKYSITAAVEGYVEETNNYAQTSGSDTQKKTTTKVIWRKEYKLLPDTSFHQRAKGISLSKDVSLKYSDYNDFAQQVIELSKYKVSTRLIVNMDVSLQAQTDKGGIKDTSAQSIELALGGNGFSVTKNEMAKKPGAIDVLKKVRIPPDKYHLTTYAVATGLLFLALLFLLIFTRSAPDANEHLRLVNKIFKKYSSRMAVLCGELKYDAGCIRHVRSMEDLVRIADEMQKPVIYKFSENIVNITQFFVFDGNWTYIFDLMAYLSPYNREHGYSTPEFVSRPQASSKAENITDAGIAEG